MDENLSKAHEILFSRFEEMKKFMNHYVFEKKNINIDTFVDDKTQFLSFIDFCLNTRNRRVEKDIDQGIKYFDENYDKIIMYINEKDLEKLQKLVYDSPGIGQKIGSMLLEFIYLYSRHYDEDIIKKLFVPIDSHTERILKNSFKLETPKMETKYTNKTFIKFQDSLTIYSNNKGRVFFDYLWFIGKIFCAKTNPENKNNRGYKLCDYCWIKECCENEEKWL